MNTSLRRQNLLAKLPERALVFIFSGHAPARSQDENYPFSVNRNFYYLTGIDRENMCLVLDKNGDKTSEMLFIEPFDPVLARWVGGKMLPEEATEISGIEDIRYINELEDSGFGRYERSLRYNLPIIYLDMWRNELGQNDSDGIKYAKFLKDKYPQLEIRDIYNEITSLRLVKSDEEIEEIKKAIAITRFGIAEMMKHIRPEMNEMMMEATFDFAMAIKGCKEHAFHTIAASGARATTLHYSENNNVMKDGELFLCDLGSAYKHYCSDISRTFPVNGKFSERQKEIYEIVLEVQRRIQEAAKPGVKMADIQKMVIDFYAEELPKHGLNKDVSEYYFHGFGHHLGLDTHDVDGGLGQVLNEGNVITDEPGLYIADEGIGIRIEDDLLITAEGAICLSQDIIKNVDDIENFMKH